MRRLLLIAATLGATAACWRLGFWQLSRWAEKRALNAELRTTLAAPPVAAGGHVPLPERIRGRRIEITGRFDSRFQVLLRGRSRDGAPGVVLVTPWLAGGDTLAVLVERGWLAADDAATVPAADIPGDSSWVVIGLARPFASDGPILPMRELPTPGLRMWSASRLDPDSLRARLPYAIAPYFLEALPATGAPSRPLRIVPRLFNEAMHLGYAVQWFLIGAFLPVGVFLFSRRRRLGASSGDSGSPTRGPGHGHA